MKTTTTLAQRLAAKGIRLTQQRRVLLGLLERSSGHLDVSKMIELARLQGCEVDRATVYRTVHLLKKHKLVTELDLLHFAGTGHFYERSDVSEHIHVGCTECGKIFEVETELLTKMRRSLAKRHDFDVQSIRVEVGGICKKCRK